MATLLASLSAYASTPVLYCQDLPTPDIEVVEAENDDAGAEIVFRYRDGRVEVRRLGYQLAMHTQTRIELPNQGETRRELYLSAGGWVLRTTVGESQSTQAVFCD